MKLALVRAGLWFFAAVIAVLLMGGDAVKRASTSDLLLGLAFAGLIFGAAAFFYTLSQIYGEERRLELRERTAKVEQLERAASGNDTIDPAP